MIMRLWIAWTSLLVVYLIYHVSHTSLRLGITYDRRLHPPAIILQDTISPNVTIVNHSFCSTLNYAPGPEAQYAVALCALQQNSRRHTCKRVQLNFDGQRKKKKGGRSSAAKQVQVCSLQWDEQLYVLAIRHSKQKAELLVMAMDNDLESKDTRLVLKANVLQQVDSFSYWAPLVSRDQLFLMTSLLPLVIVQPDLVTGTMVMLQKGTKWANDVQLFPKDIQLALLNGSPWVCTNFINFGDDEHLAIFSVNTSANATQQYLVTIKHHIPDFSIEWVQPIRMPVAMDMTGPLSKQFAAGLIREHDDLTVMFGSPPCHGVLGQLKGFVRQLHHIQKTGVPFEDSRPVAFLSTSREQVPVVRWEGPVQDFSSFGVVARHLGVRLVQKLKDSMILQWNDTSSKFHMNVTNIDHWALIGQNIMPNATNFPNADATIRMRWPPSFEPPPSRVWIQYLPWEFYHMPMEWVKAVVKYGTEIWVPSSYNQQGYIDSGIPAKQVHVVPHGVDAMKLCPSFRRATAYVKSLKAQFGGKFVFFFRGGALWRKGIDILLKAYFAAFSSRDKVVLLMHVVYGNRPVYRMLNRTMERYKTEPGLPEIRLIREEVSDEEIHLMYAVADAYVHPARAEGYGLTIAEAMACGVPVIVPDIGGHTDFVSNETGFLVKGKLSPCRKYPCTLAQDGQPHRVFNLQLKKAPLWVETDPLDLGRMMRHVIMSKSERRRKRALARTHMLRKGSWDMAAAGAAARLKYLLGESVTEVAKRDRDSSAHNTED